ncbi:hypothetical protein E4U21_004996 [Claviceps maximensis]|nr:hypothetical protein E4U21_004996 [Claviceps maximensis]
MGQIMLSQDLIEQQLAQIDLLMAMFPGEDNVFLSEEATMSLEAWRSLQSHAEIDELPPTISTSLPLLLTLDLNLDPDLDLDLDVHETVMPNKALQLQLDITVPFFTSHGDERDADEPPCPGVRLVQPSWMSKAEAASLTATAPKNQDLLSLIQHFRDGASGHLARCTASITVSACHPRTIDTEMEPLVRTWFYFPSISTRSKRADLVNYAPAYTLTGFLLSGKPGILCLEGTAHSIDAYMKFIKTESWSDIPAYQKKVTERFREHAVTRVFADMQEITDSLGERRGERANRGDMRLLETWMVERGLGDAFMKVFI